MTAENTPDNPNQIKEFFAVTKTSIYHVVMEEGPNASAKKIALHAPSEVPVGDSFRGPMLAICKQLIAYVPEGGGMTSYERNIESVNMRWWTGNSSLIVALFKDEKAARECSGEKDLVPCDPRWLKETTELLRAIGNDHPAFSICTWKDMQLLDSSLWK